MERKKKSQPELHTGKGRVWSQKRKDVMTRAKPIESIDKIQDLSPTSGWAESNGLKDHEQYHVPSS